MWQESVVFPLFFLIKILLISSDVTRIGRFFFPFFLIKILVISSDVTRIGRFFVFAFSLLSLLSFYVTGIGRIFYFTHFFFICTYQELTGLYCFYFPTFYFFLASLIFMLKKKLGCQSASFNTFSFLCPSPTDSSPGWWMPVSLADLNSPKYCFHSSSICTWSWWQAQDARLPENSLSSTIR